MKPLLIMPLAGVLMAVASAADRPPVSPLAERLKEEYRYSPPDNAAAPEVDEEVVTMEAFTVVESVRRRDLERVVEQQERQIRDQKYSVVKGGTLLSREVGRARVELGTWRGGGGLEFLKISW